MLIRRMTHDDIAAVAAIEAAEQPSPWPLAVFEDCIRVKYKNLVISDNEIIIGYLIASQVLDECHILNICVTKQKQRQGLGRQLMDLILKEAKDEGIKMVYLEVRESNQVAIHLYERLGFCETTTRKAYYPMEGGRREDALLMMKSIL